MSDYLPQALRRLVFERAGDRCEYCLVHSRDAIISHQVDHIIAIKHHGLTVAENLALACIECNLHKGSDLTTMNWQIGEIVPIFHPRQQRWTDHFALQSARLIGLTHTGIATISLLQLNREDRLEFRELLLDAGLYPPVLAALI
jgi:hypothetical protein